MPRKNKLKPSMPSFQSALPEGGRDGQPVELVETMTDLDNAKHRVLRNRREHPLDYLRDIRVLTECQYLAGDRLRAHWERASISPGSATNWDASGGCSGNREHMTAGQMDALTSVSAAMRVVGMSDAGLVTAVIYERQTLAAIKRARGRTTAYWGGRLSSALDRLAEHYGFIKRHH